MAVLLRMRSSAVGSLLILAVMLGGEALSQGLTCPQYRIQVQSGQSGIGSTGNAACSTLASALSGTQGSETTTVTLSASFSGQDTFSCTGTRVDESSAGSCGEPNPPAWCRNEYPVEYEGGIVEQIPCGPSACDPQDPLTAAQTGKKFTSANLGDLSAYSSDFCSPVTACKVKVNSAVSAGGETLWTMEYTSESCPEGSEDVPEEDLENAESCAQVGDGEYCASSTGKGQCGYFNDRYICLDKVKGGCRNVAGGGRICDASVNTTPPVPDSGTPGVPATPDGTVQAKIGQGNTTNNFNYYSSATVNNSSRDTNDGKSDTGGTEDATDEPPVQAGELPELPEQEPTDSLTSAFLDRVAGSPIGSSLSGLGNSFPEGECPQGTLNLFGESIEFDTHCSMFEDIAPLLSGLFIALWGLVGLRIIMSA